MNLPRFTSITTRIVAAMVLVVTALMAWAGFLAERLVHREMLDLLRVELDSESSQIASSLSLPVWNFDREQVNRVMDSVLQRAFVAGVEVKLSDRQATRFSRESPPGRLPAGGQILNAVRTIHHPSDDQILGTVELRVSTGLLEQRLRRYRLMMMLAGLAIDALLVVALYALLQRSVLRPLREIEQFAANRGVGEQLSEAHYQGELENLRTSLVTMISQLRNNENRLRLIGDNLPDSMVYQVTRDAAGVLRFLYVSAGVERLHGLTRREVEADAYRLFGQALEEDRAAMQAAEAQALGSLKPFSYVVRIRHTNGSIRWLDVRSQPRRLEDGQIVWDGVETDITARKQIEAERERLGRVIDSHDDAAFWVSPQNRIVYVNDAACRSVGYERDELIGSYLTLIAAEPTPGLYEQLWTKLRRDGAFQMERILRRKDGTTFPTDVSTTLVRIDGQELACAFARDISARKHAERQLHEQLDELKRWHVITLDREDRVTQLKAEVNTLCARLGEPAPYGSQIAAHPPAHSGGRS